MSSLAQVKKRPENLSGFGCVHANVRNVRQFGTVNSRGPRIRVRNMLKLAVDPLAGDTIKPVPCRPTTEFPKERPVELRSCRNTRMRSTEVERNLREHDSAEIRSSSFAGQTQFEYGIKRSQTNRLPRYQVHLGTVRYE